MLPVDLRWPEKIVGSKPSPFGAPFIKAFVVTGRGLPLWSGTIEELEGLSLDNIFYIPKILLRPGPLPDRGAPTDAKVFSSTVVLVATNMEESIVKCRLPKE